MAICSDMGHLPSLGPAPRGSGAPGKHRQPSPLIPREPLEAAGQACHLQQAARAQVLRHLAKQKPLRSNIAELLAQAGR